MSEQTNNDKALVSPQTDKSFGGAFTLVTKKYANGDAVTVTGKSKSIITYAKEKLGCTDRDFASVTELKQAFGKDRVKELSKELAKAKTLRLIHDRKLAVAVTGDPNMRLVVAESHGKKGMLGFNVRARFQPEAKAKKLTKDARIAQLEAICAERGISVPA
jgi:hypothetical protein